MGTIHSFICGRQFANNMTIERFISAQGKFTIKLIILYHIDGYFVMRFRNKEQRDIVLSSGPHYMMRRPVIIKPWTLEFNFKEEILTTIPLWVKLPNLPLNCWNSVVLSKIGSSQINHYMQMNVQHRLVVSHLQEFQWNLISQNPS